MALWLLFINIAAFITFGIDKWKAEQHMWRIPEATLLGLAAAGGSIGALAGMRFFHHKTRKPLFAFGIPALLVLQVLALAGLGFDPQEFTRRYARIKPFHCQKKTVANRFYIACSTK